MNLCWYCGKRYSDNYAQCGDCYQNMVDHDGDPQEFFKFAWFMHNMANNDWTSSYYRQIGDSAAFGDFVEEVLEYMSKNQRQAFILKIAEKEAQQ